MTEPDTDREPGGRRRLILRRVAVTAAVLLVIYPVAYLGLRASGVLVHQQIPMSTSWIPGDPVSADEYPLPTESEARSQILFDYTWHDVGRGSPFDGREHWGEKGVVALFRPLVECEMIVRGFSEVPVRVREMRWTAEIELGKAPPDLTWIEHESRRCSRWEFGEH